MKILKMVFFIKIKYVTIIVFEFWSVMKIAAVKFKSSRKCTKCVATYSDVDYNFMENLVTFVTKLYTMEN